MTERDLIKLWPIVLVVVILGIGVSYVARGALTVHLQHRGASISMSVVSA
jgi:hypothetical protein